MAAGGARACRGPQVRSPWCIRWWRPCPSCRRRKPGCRSWQPYGRGWSSRTVTRKPHPPSCRTRYLGRMGWAEATAHHGAGWRTSPGSPGTHQATGVMDSWGLLPWLGNAQEGEVARVRALATPILITLVPYSSWFPGTRTTALECRAAHVGGRGAGRGRDAARPESTPSTQQP